MYFSSLVIKIYTFCLIAILVQTAFGYETVGSSMLNDEAESSGDVLQTAQDLNCSALNINETRFVSLPFLGNTRSDSSSKSKMNVQTTYFLTKLSDKSYRATLPIEFYNSIPQPSSGSGGGFLLPNSNSIVAQNMKKRVKECLSKTNSQLRSGDGMQIEISIDPDPKMMATYKPPVTKIQVVGPHERSNRVRFNEDASCATITHELLHHLGLVDEHTETAYRSNGVLLDGDGLPVRDRVGEVVKKTNSSLFDCRATHEIDSAMLDPQKIFGTIKQQHCCKCITSSCIKPIQVLSRMLRISQFDVPSCAKGYERGKRVGENDYCIFQEKDPAVQPTLPALLPAHTRHIIYPGCESKNSKYYRCASSAYESSIKHGCRTLPRYCLTNEWVQ